MKNRTIATEAFTYGKRSFFLDFMVARNKSNYIQITKREKQDDGSFATRRLAVFMDDFEWLISGFTSLLHTVAHIDQKECTVLDLFTSSRLQKQSGGIKAWDPALRPRERILGLGATALDSKELIALLLGSGSKQISAVELAEQILCSVDGDLARLSLLKAADFSTFNGMGIGKTCALLAAFELGRRIFSGSTEVVPSKIDERFRRAAL